MASERDPLPHRLARQRLVAALTTRDSDPARFRNAGAPVLAGLLITALVATGVIGWAQWSPGGDQWRRPDVVVMQAESGTRFLWRDERLHPLANYTSAQLILADPAPEVVSVPGSQLHDITRGAPIGLVGVPDTVPPAEHIATGRWAVCSVPGQHRPAAGEKASMPSTLLMVGAAPAEGQRIGDGAVPVASALPAVLPGAPEQPDPLPTPVLPQRDDQVVCAVTDASDRVHLRAEAVLPAPGDRLVGDGVDEVALAGPAALAVTDGTVWLVGPDGRRHAVAPAALSLLGLSELSPAPVPQALLTLLPEGPTIDPTALD